MSEILKSRYEFVLLFDVENGNPNGDPDAGNMPRIDPETNNGIVTDVCLKRKIRNYVEFKKREEKGFRIYVKEGAVLNNIQKEPYTLNGWDYTFKDVKGDEKTKKIDACKKFMCDNFFDIRTFGAVMTTEVNCGQVRGPVQMSFARSVDPILQQEISITRMAVTNERDADKERTIGRKHIVPYGLYRVEGFISAFLAEKTGFNSDDLSLLWESLENMFEHDRSSARGKMSARKLIIFEHKDLMGNAPANKLFELVKVTKKDLGKPARSFQDYSVEISKNNIPEGVTLIER